MERFDDWVVVITGGSHGIGKATAERFLAEGAHVEIWDVDENAAKDAFNKWNITYESKNNFQVLDVSDYTEVEKAVARILELHGRIDVLINNAGITMDGTLLKMAPEKWQKVIDVNLTGVFNCTRLIADQMAKQGKGVILNASSVVALYGNFGQTNYVASKTGVIGMTKVWARELGKKGIRVNAVAPGFIATEMISKMPEEVLQTMISKIPMGRTGAPEDIANAYAFLASDEASYITGTVLSVDGGIVI